METPSIQSVIAKQQLSKLAAQRWRLIKDHLVRYSMGLGGGAVIAAITLIFIYLLYVVFPLFMPASVELKSSYPAQVASANVDSDLSEVDLDLSEVDLDLNEVDSGLTEVETTLYLAMEEQNEVGLRVTGQGRLVFFNTQNGAQISTEQVPLPADSVISSFARAERSTGILAFGMSNGQVVVSRHVYRVTYPDDRRLITPVLEFPLGEEPLVVDRQGQSLLALAMQNNEEEATVVAVTQDQRVVLAHYSKQISFLDDEVSVEAENIELTGVTHAVDYVLLDKEQRMLYLQAKTGELSIFDISDKQQVELVDQLNLVKPGRRVRDIQLLAGDISLLVADDKGTVAQWFSVRNEQNQSRLTRIRQFNAATLGHISAVVPEFYRKAFIVSDNLGHISMFHTTAERQLIDETLLPTAIRHLAISPRANALLAEDEDGRLHFITLNNEHPEVSWSSLWGKVWYESYPEPDYIWQSSSASNDFEPKFSLAPLAFGTLKAAFYAMLLAVPLAIMGAIYTAYFMAPRMRRLVKPGIEIMEALPTVILGFLAGLWLAPYMEANLPGIFALSILVPVGVLVFAYAWHCLPDRIRHRVADGWDAALLIPVILITGWLALTMNYTLEQWLFDGDMRRWLSDELGIGFDQRNAMVVGLAMGFAVIPTIFSMTEDAIFSVPKHLRNGSLALGANQWQTLVRVVLLTASPGIFAAIMIGMGRAVGETMIVLMATGNTAVMDLNLFEGMRTLSANIAVEMPESEVDSTHYRILFLAALVLFMFTFILNTFGELVRQRLRKRYSNL